MSLSRLPRDAPLHYHQPRSRIFMIVPRRNSVDVYFRPETATNVNYYRVTLAKTKNGGLVYKCTCPEYEYTSARARRHLGRHASGWVACKHIVSALDNRDVINALGLTEEEARAWRLRIIANLATGYNVLARIYKILAIKAKYTSKLRGRSGGVSTAEYIRLMEMYRRRYARLRGYEAYA